MHSRNNYKIPPKGIYYIKILCVAGNMNRNKRFALKITALVLLVQLLLCSAGILVYSVLFKSSLLLSSANAEAFGELEKLRFDVCALALILLVCLIFFAVIFSLLLSRIREHECRAENPEQARPSF